MFLFYATPMLPFMVLSIVLVIGLIMGPADALPARARVRRGRRRGVRPHRAGQLLLPVSRAGRADHPVRRVARPDVVRLVDLNARTRVWRDGQLEEEDFPAARISDYLAEPDTVVWLDLCSPDDEGLQVISEEFGLDPLAVEDAVSHHERPKLDRYDGYLFLNAYAVRLSDESGKLETFEISAFITDRALVTVREDEGLRHRRPRSTRWDATPDLAEHGVAYLLHGLLDLIVDDHFDAVQALDNEIEGLEERLFADEVPDRGRPSSAATASARASRCCAGSSCRCARSSTPCSAATCTSCRRR